MDMIRADVPLAEEAHLVLQERLLARAMKKLEVYLHAEVLPILHQRCLMAVVRNLNRNLSL